MDYRKKLIEYLSEPENMKFLLDIEQLIPEAKEYKYRACFEDLIQKFITTKNGEAYKIDIIDDDLKLITNSDNISAFSIAIYIGTGDSNNYYGIIGEPTFDEKIEVQKLRNTLSDMGMKGRWKHWLAWKYFDRNRSELLSLPRGRQSEEFLEQWAEAFWFFADGIRQNLMAVNSALSNKSS